MAAGSGGSGSPKGAGNGQDITAVIERAPAKINLALHVTGQREDGYHTLHSLVTFANAADRVHVLPAASDRFVITGPCAGPLRDATSNLVLAARDALRALLERIGEPAPPVAIELEKVLPIAGGVGGGSADAAATIRALVRVWNARPTPAELTDLGRTIGADVPMCLLSRPLEATGIGETVRPLSPFPSFDIVLVNPGRPVSTPAVFSALARRSNRPFDIPGDWGRTTDCIRALAAMRNDLEATARTLVPEIGSAHDALVDAGALFARMSGSGPTCFGIFSGAEVAHRAALTIRRRHPQWYVADCRTFYGVAGGSR